MKMGKRVELTSHRRSTNVFNTVLIMIKEFKRAGRNCSPKMVVMASHFTYSCAIYIGGNIGL